MPIKPEDVTDNHIKQIKDYLEGQFGWPLMPDNSQLATLANALIEAGIVSPPVWVGRSTVNGKLLNLTCRKSTKPNTGELIEFEHWKGQTE
jgi:hypothetical protein